MSLVRPFCNNPLTNIAVMAGWQPGLLMAVTLTSRRPGAHTGSFQQWAPASERVVRTMHDRPLSRWVARRPGDRLWCSVDRRAGHCEFQLVRSHGRRRRHRQSAVLSISTIFSSSNCGAVVVTLPPTHGVPTPTRALRSCVSVAIPCRTAKPPPRAAVTDAGSAAFGHALLTANVANSLKART